MTQRGSDGNIRILKDVYLISTPMRYIGITDYCSVSNEYLRKPLLKDLYRSRQGSRSFRIPTSGINFVRKLRKRKRRGE